MHSTRRLFLIVAGSALAAASAFLIDFLRPFRPRAARAADGSWSLRRATYDDLADLRDIFNAQLQAGCFLSPITSSPGR
jgi:hypothetical protein